MDKREGALREALHKNEDETQRWQNYLKENQTAIENMSMFGKRVTVDVMVPVGKKAFMTGHLLHTNEVLVGHYQGYFSKCTTFKAKEICEMRIKMGQDHLKMLETEADLWQNKLEKPYVEGIMPSGEVREIIEDYHEETEKLWKEKHRNHVKLAKQKEREEREKELHKVAKQKQSPKNKNDAQDKTDEKILKMLEEAELMEELEQELDKLDIDEVNDETIRKLMAGEIKLPQEKNRLAPEKTSNGSETTEESVLLTNIVKKNDMQKSSHISTNNNIQPNPVITDQVNSQEEDETEEESIPKEVALIKEQAKFLNAEDQIGFYDYQIEITRQKIQTLPLRTQQELDEKIHLLNVLEHLEELLEVAEETVGAEELAEKESELKDKIEEDVENQEKEFTGDSGKILGKELIEVKSNKEKSSVSIDINKSNQKRRISFALEDETLEFRKHEAVTQMLPSKMEKPQRDIIKLDDKEKDTVEKKSDLLKKPLDKKDLIQAIVETNLQFVSENQSKQDFDLIQQILQSSMGEVNTLHIQFKHSQQENSKRDNRQSFDIPGSPADFYDLYKKSQKSLDQNEPSTLFINSYEGEDQVRAPVLKEADRQAAFADPKAEFSNPSLQARPILKNKSAVDKENHLKDTIPDNSNTNKKSKKKSNKKEDDDCLSAYYKVMNDVVEKPLTEPEPLPDGKFIDAHTPKKRISRFKQMRQEKT